MEENPWHAIFTPMPLKGTELQGKFVIDAAAGEEFSLILCENPQTKVQEVYACGNNLRGQLGINRMSHV